MRLPLLQICYLLHFLSEYDNVSKLRNLWDILEALKSFWSELSLWVTSCTFWIISWFVIVVISSSIAIIIIIIIIIITIMIIIIIIIIVVVVIVIIIIIIIMTVAVIIIIILLYLGSDFKSIGYLGEANLVRHGISVRH